MSCLNKPYDKCDPNGGEEGEQKPSRTMLKKCWTVLAGLGIVLMVVVLTLVWVQVGNGTFKAKRYYGGGSGGDNETGLEDITTLETTKETLIQPQSSSSSLPSTLYSQPSPSPTHLNYEEAEYVTPIKTSPPPLHDQDRMYDKMRNYDGQAKVAHHSGHFRHEKAELWDPHPQYRIEAFGKTIVLDLFLNDKLVSDDLHVTHIWSNYSQRIRHNSSAAECHYTGKVSGDKSSIVAVSLCGGMSGTIKTAEYTYEIHPVEDYDYNGNHTPKHVIKRHRNVDEFHGVAATRCETIDKDEQDEDFPDIMDDQRTHHVSKRSYDFNTYDTEVTEESTKQYSYVNQYIIETMVVADKKMAEYHRSDEELIRYVLTLMSHVAFLFKDASIGHPISITVVDIIILREQEFTSSTSQEMLRKFCQFQSDHSKGTHDVALLLTRDVICNNSTTNYCSTLGIAEVASMCNPIASCAVVRDKGLSTSYTIAHEFGHVLSMPHDDDDRKCIRLQKGVKANNIMRQMLHNDTQPWHWSNCSKHYLTEFLVSPRSRCLLDKPDKVYVSSDFPEFPFFDMLPGERFEVNKQCELEFGNGSKLCTYMPRCGSLWCTTQGGGCKTQHMPWAEGTACGKGRWCHHRKCITLDRNILSPVSGGWSEWKEWSPCTRTCGGGIMISKRECNNPPPANGGPYCTGGNTHYSSCNAHACESDVPSFRELQCEEFNGNPKGIANLTSDVRWVPKYGGMGPEDYCKLYCRVEGSNAYYLLRNKVIDGTKCGLNSFNICVNGICNKGGCDNRLASNKTLDECGICNGNGSTCRDINGYYNESGIYGYNRVTIIPKGSLNINISQTGLWNTHKDENYLVLRDSETGAYILNGNYKVSPSKKEIVYEGLTMIYSGSNQVTEYIKTPQKMKLAKDLLVEVLTVGTKQPPNILFSYTINAIDNNPRYEWNYYNGNWTTCDSICQGHQTPVMFCVDLQHNQVASSSYCNGLYKATSSRRCNSHCKLVWAIASRGQCSSDCGEGKRSLTYNCVKKSLRSDEEEVVDEKHCHVLDTPPASEQCFGDCSSTNWHYDEWSPCPRTCGGSIQYRRAICIDQDNNALDDSNCNEEEKVVEQRCNTNQCPQWSANEWTPCSVTCGIGFRKKPYFCLIGNQITREEHCDKNELPIIEEKCEMDPCPRMNLKWTVNEWSVCQRDDNRCIMKRDVTCKMNLGDVDDAYCINDGREKPAKEKECYCNDDEDIHNNNIYHYTTYERTYSWIAKPWTDCIFSNNTCRKTRQVYCNAGKEKPHKCYGHAKPAETLNCNFDQCGTWTTSRWTKCDRHCYKYRTFQCRLHTGEQVDSSHCAGIKKQVASKLCKKKCRKHLNHIGELRNIPRWKIFKWGPCSSSCGEGVRTRSVVCYSNHHKVVEAFCSEHREKPRTSESCSKAECRYVWRAGAWSQCSASCGKGEKYRNVTCHEVTAYGISPSQLDFKSLNPTEYCNIFVKPDDKAPCNELDCDYHYRWEAGEWGECPQRCVKNNVRKRPVRCKDRKLNVVSQHLCNRSLKPRHREKCNGCVHKSCKDVRLHSRTQENNEYILTLKGKAISVYCYKMDTAEPEEFISLKQDDQNFAEIYDRRLRDTQSCPYGGQRNDNCDCERLTENYGRTSFWKVKLNVTAMRIITNDFTFTQHTSDHKISYGTAGDCYSNTATCPQGRFSVDLSGTSFKISKNVQWVKSGKESSMNVWQGDKRVYGHCGGNCGSCHPDHLIGLQVEVT